MGSPRRSASGALAALVALTALASAGEARAQAVEDGLFGPGSASALSLRGPGGLADRDERPEGKRDSPSGRRQGPVDPAGRRPSPTGAGSGGDGDLVGQNSSSGLLQIRDPTCSSVRTSEARRACERSGSVASRYPVSNYQIDTHIDTDGGVLPDFEAVLANLFAGLANMVWQLALMLLQIVLLVFGWVYALNPFGDADVLREIGSGLESFYSAFSEGYLLAAFVLIGAAVLWRGLVQGKRSESIAGLAMTILLMLAAFWVMSDPRGTVGRLAAFVEDAALTVVSAPSEGAEGNPADSYAEVTDEIWDNLTRAPFTALNFTDADWASAPPSDEALAISNRFLCSDAAQPPDCDPRSEPRPASVVDLYLRSSVGSPARHALWRHYSAGKGADDIGGLLDEDGDEGEGRDHDKVSQQGEEGAFIRLPLALLVLVGLAGAFALLAWLAIRLFVQTAVGFVLLLITPLALLFPAFGEAGRAATRTWGLTLLGAIVAKLVYSALLGIVMFGANVIYGLGEPAGKMMGFLLASAFYWAVFLKREEMVSWMSISREEGGSGALGTLGGVYAATRLGQMAWGKLRGDDEERGERERYGRRDGPAPERKLAEAQEEAEARALAYGEARYASARSGLQAAGERQRELESRRAEAARLRARGAELLTRSAGGGALAGQGQELIARAEALESEADELSSSLAAEAPELERAQAIVEAADQNEAQTGARFTREQVRGFRETVRSQLERPVESGEHAWRVGMAPREYEALSGGERARAQALVRDALRKDGRRFGMITSRPQGLPSGGADGTGRAYGKVLRAEHGRLKGELHRAENRIRDARRRYGRARERQRARR